MQRLSRTQITEIAVAATLVVLSHPALDHDEVGVFVSRAFDRLHQAADLVPARDIADETNRMLAKTFASHPEAGAPTKMQRLLTMLTACGNLAAEIEHEEGRPVSVLLLTDDRNNTIRGVLAPTVTAYQRP